MSDETTIPEPPTETAPPAPRPTGRPTKFDAEIAKKVLDLLARGNYVETAAAAAGVSKVTIYTWLRKGARAKSGPFHDFSLAVDKAQADAEVLDLARLEKMAMKGDFRAISWRLERRNARRWGPQIQVSVHQVLDEYLGMLQTNMKPEEFEKVLALTLAWDGNATPRVG